MPPADSLPGGTAVAGSRAAALHREMRVTRGPVPETLGDLVLDVDGFMLSGSAFLFTTRGGVRFHYALKQGVTAYLPGPECEDEFRLFLWGTVFGAVAWLNGYFPLHASAVAVEEQVIAFTADSGGGKSTLAAALAGKGFAHVADDTLPLWLDGAAALAIPDRKPLKLWADAFGLVNAERLEPISSMPGKSYAQASLRLDHALPLTALVVLREGEGPVLNEVRGVAKLDVLVGSMYRDFIPGALGRSEDYHRNLLALANGIRVFELTRPRALDKVEFDRTVEQIGRLLCSIKRAT